MNEPADKMLKVDYANWAEEVIFKFIYIPL